MSIIPALGRVRQEDRCEFKISKGSSKSLLQTNSTSKATSYSSVTEITPT